MVRLPWNKKQTSIGTLSLKCDHQGWLWTWPWIFKVKYGIRYISATMVLLPRNEMQTYHLNSGPQMRPSGMTLTLNFQGQYWICYILRQNDQIVMKQKKCINWTLGLKCVHQSWPWTSRSTFWMALTKHNRSNMEFGISGLIARKANILIEL